MRRYALFVALVFALLGAPDAAAAPSEVTVSGHQLIVRKRLADGSLAPAAPFTIRGVVWSPASRTTNTFPSDPANAAVRRPEFAIWDDIDVPLLAAMHVNTVRLLLDPGVDAAGTAVLDRLYENGIMVVMTVDDAVNDLARIDQVVPFYKNHPAVLMWMLGNEWNINLYYGKASSVADAAQRTQTAAARVKSLDPAHPVSTSYGEIDINDAGRHLADTQQYVQSVCPGVDVWGVNVYRGNSFGNLFAQWASITSKPMLLGEFGTDAFRSAGSTSAGTEDGVTQSDWDLHLWNEVFVNLSANTPEAVALGAFVFEFSDEWWKVAGTVNAHNSGGYAGAHPDDYANEEYFGIVDIDRNPRPLYAALTAAFDPSYVPPAAGVYRVISRGADAEEYGSQYGTVWMLRDSVRLYRITGGAGGGRGFSVGVFDPATGALQQPVQIFDTWSSSNAFCSMNTFLDAVPNGMLLLFGVADEAGLTQFPPNGCQQLGGTCRTEFRNRIAALGGQQLGSYCYRGSWAMAAVKGEGVARAEQVGSAVEVSARTTLPVPMRTLSLTFDGSGSVRSVPAALQCSVACSAAFPLGSAVTLHAIPAAGSYVSGWSGACSGLPPCSVTLSQDVAVQAKFVAASSLTLTATGSASATAGVPITVTVTLREPSGDVAGGYRGTVHFTSDDALAVLPSDFAFTAGDAGTHAFQVVFKTSGPRTVTATDVAATGVTGSLAVSVSAAPSRIDLSAPATVGLGKPANTLAVVQAANSGDPQIATGTVTFSEGSQLVGTVTLAGGQAALSIRLATTGMHTITAAYSGDSHFLGAQTTANVTVNYVPNTLYRGFDGNQKPDILWRNTANGNNSVWFMNGTTLAGGAELQPVPDVNWQLAGAADFNGDGATDLLWRRPMTGQNAVWLMNGTARIGAADLPAVSDPNWNIEATGDFNGDDVIDIVWHNHATGWVVIWTMNGTSLVSGAEVSYAVDLNWHVAGAADFDLDGQNDLLWRHATNGMNVIWRMNGGTLLGGVQLPGVADNDWTIGAVGDYTGDGKADIVWRNRRNGMNVIWKMNGTILVTGIEIDIIADLNWTMAGPR